MAEAKEFFSAAKHALQEVKNTQREAVYEAAKMMGDCMLENGLVQLFGLGHGLAFSMELGYRAGGLMPFHQIKMEDLLLRGVVSPEEAKQPDFNDRTDLADKLWNMYNIDDHDMFILISNPANNGVIVEFAKKIKEKGRKLIVVTSKAEAEASVSRHPSGKKLTDYADLILDNCAPSPDMVVTLENGQKINQVSTVTGNVIAQMLCAETYRYLTGLGHDCPVLLSANVKGADVHNREISDVYLGRWNS